MNFEEIEEKKFEIFNYLYETESYDFHDINDLEDNDNYAR